MLGQFGINWEVGNRLGIIRDWFKPGKPNGRFVFERFSEKVQKKIEIWSIFVIFLLFFVNFWITHTAYPG